MMRQLFARVIVFALPSSSCHFQHCLLWAFGPAIQGALKPADAPLIPRLI